MRVDAHLKPTGRPALLLGQGFDLRAIMLNACILLFYSIMARDAHGLINGFPMAVQLAVSEASGRRRTQAPAGAQRNWEKNWVAFLYMLPFVPDHEQPHRP